MIAVLPAILAKDKQDFEMRLSVLKNHFTKAQIDVVNESIIEGHSWAEPEDIESIVGTMKFEVHLMVDLKDYDLEQWNRAWIEKIILHVENGNILKEKMDLIKSWNKKVFLAINPDTPLEELKPFVKKADGVMFMTIDPGRMGNEFRPLVMDTIREFHDSNPDVELEVDGGITNDTLPPILSLGVSTVAVGSYFQNDKIEDHLLEVIPIVEHFEGQK